MEKGNLDDSNVNNHIPKTNQSDSELPKDLVLIYSTEDERIRKVGNLLSSDTSRKILTMLFAETLTAKQIAQRMSFDIPLAKHHIDRMLELGIIKIAKITKSVKDRDVKYYTASHLAVVILSPSAVNNAKKSKIFIRSFKTIHKIAVVCIASISTWFGTWLLQNTQTVNLNFLLSLYTNNEKSQIQFEPDSSTIDIPDTQTSNDLLSSLWNNLWINVQNDLFWPTIFTIIVITAGLFLIWHKKR